MIGTSGKASIMNNTDEKFPLDMSPQSAGAIDLSDDDILDMFLISQY